MEQRPVGPPWNGYGSSAGASDSTGWALPAHRWRRGLPRAGHAPRAAAGHPQQGLRGSRPFPRCGAFAGL